jgi:hypothetical protein
MASKLCKYVYKDHILNAGEDTIVTKIFNGSTIFRAWHVLLSSVAWTRAHKQVYVRKQSKRNTGAESTQKVGL